MLKFFHFHRPFKFKYSLNLCLVFVGHYCYLASWLLLSCISNIYSSLLKKESKNKKVRCINHYKNSSILSLILRMSYIKEETIRLKTVCITWKFRPQRRVADAALDHWTAKSSHINFHLKLCKSCFPTWKTTLEHTFSSNSSKFMHPYIIVIFVVLFFFP